MFRIEAFLKHIPNINLKEEYITKKAFDFYSFNIKSKNKIEVLVNIEKMQIEHKKKYFNNDNKKILVKFLNDHSIKEE
jgi:hypothetical protein